LPFLPNDLKILSCNNNNLEEILFIPEKLEELYYINNKLIINPSIPKSVKIINYK
jgi:hypothetical protein